jgi:transposase
VKTKTSDLRAQFQRLCHRRGPKKAIYAVVASILTAVYHMLRDGTFYQDLGANHYQTASPQAQTQRLANQIARLGLVCTIIEPHEAVVSV